MGIEHQLARLAPKGSQIDGSGFGGYGTLTQNDIAASLAGLHGPIYWYMRVKFCGDWTMLDRLRNNIAWNIMGEAIAGNADITAKQANGIAKVVISQAIQGPICELCNGTGRLVAASASEDCKVCKGTGRLTMTQVRAAEVAGVSVPTYTKHYQRTVGKYLSVLQQMESDGLAHCARRLYID